MADNNPLRGAYLTCANEIRRLVVHASTEYHQSNSYIAEFFKISKRTVQTVIQRNVHISLMIWQQQETDYKFQPML